MGFKGASLRSDSTCFMCVGFDGGVVWCGVLSINSTLTHSPLHVCSVIY